MYVAASEYSVFFNLQKASTTLNKKSFYPDKYNNVKIM